MFEQVFYYRKRPRHTRRRGAFALSSGLKVLHSTHGPLINLKVRERLRNYLLQCGLATPSLFVILMFQDVVLRVSIVVVAAFTAFIIFVSHKGVAASPRKVIGGHVVGVVSGSVVSFVVAVLDLYPAAEGSSVALNIVAALSVGAGIFGMAVSETEHPPEAGTALGPRRSRLDSLGCGIHHDLRGGVVRSSGGPAFEAGEPSVNFRSIACAMDGFVSRPSEHREGR